MYNLLFFVSISQPIFSSYIRYQVAVSLLLLFLWKRVIVHLCFIFSSQEHVSSSWVCRKPVAQHTQLLLPWRFSQCLVAQLMLFRGEVLLPEYSVVMLLKVNLFAVEYFSTSSFHSVYFDLFSNSLHTVCGQHRLWHIHSMRLHIVIVLFLSGGVHFSGAVFRSHIRQHENHKPLHSVIGYVERTDGVEWLTSWFAVSLLDL